MEIARTEQRRNRWILLATYLYLGLLFAYALHGAYTESGLPGLVVDSQMRLLGFASLKMTLVLTMLVGCIPLLALVTVFKKIAFAETKAFLVYANPRNASFPNPMTWGFVFAIPAGMALLGAVIAAVLYVGHKQEEAKPVDQVDLATAPAGPDQHQGYISLNGNVPKKFIVTSKAGELWDAFAPVVESNWTQAAPVRYLVHCRTASSEHGSPILPAPLTDGVPYNFTGTLSHGISGTVARKLLDEKINVPDGLAVVEWGDIPSQRADPFYVDVFITIAVTVAVSGMTFLMLCFARWQNARVLPPKP